MSKKAKLLMIQGTSSGAGKSTIVTGLCRVFSDMGYKVAPFKSQNMSSKIARIDGDLTIAGVQAVQALACRKKPDARMNPILLKPIGNYKSEVIVNGKHHSELHSRDYYSNFVLQQGFPAALRALDSLRSENDLVIMEGAGSPAEINIAKYDIANMLLASKVSSPVIIVADIERGGCFASIVGTMQLLRPAHRKLVKGFLINKFRGDVAILAPAINPVEKITKKKILGVIPKIEFNLPEEDSLDGSSNKKTGSNLNERQLDKQIGVLSDALKASANIERIKEVASL